MKPAIQAVWFDLDDTLFDHTHAVRCGMEALRHRCPSLRRHTAAELALLYNQALDAVYGDFLLGKAELTETRLRKLDRLYTSTGIAPDDILPLDEFQRIYEAAYFPNRRTTPGCAEMLARLQEMGLALAILTNGRQSIQEEKLRVIGLEWMIPLLLTSEKAGMTKPDPGIYLWALAQTGHAPESVWMIGDNLENDVEAALGCGLRAALYAPAAKDPQIQTACGTAPILHSWHALTDCLDLFHSSMAPDQFVPRVPPSAAIRLRYDEGRCAQPTDEIDASSGGD